MRVDLILKVEVFKINEEEPIDIAILKFKEEQLQRLTAVQKIKTVEGVTQIVLAQLTSHLDALASIPKKGRYPKGKAFREFLESFEKLTIFRRISLLDLDWFLQCSLETCPGFTRGVEPPKNERKIIKSLCNNFHQEKDLDLRLSNFLVELRKNYPETLKPSDNSDHWMVDIETVSSLTKSFFKETWNTTDFLKQFSGALIIWRQYRCPAVHEPFSPLRNAWFLKSKNASFLPEHIGNAIRSGYGAFPTAILLEEAVKEGIEILCKNFEEKGKLPPEVAFEYLPTMDAVDCTDIDLL